jgi:undecaprenyl-diphosphatase
MEPWQAALYGALQGLTEFLPVSSSGHLVIAKALLGFGRGMGALWEIAAHLGTFAAICVVFRRDLGALAAGCLRGVGRGVRGEGIRAVLASEDQVWLALAIVLGSVPAAVVGLGMKAQIERLFDAPAGAALMLIFTGAVLASTAGLPPGDRRRVRLRDALVIGLAQAAAILPGVSRSGMTIAAALWIGLERSEAGRFSFLLALPALAGAAVLESGHGWRLAAAHPGAMALVVGSAFLVGVAALALLMRLVRGGKLDRFAWYCLPLGTILGIWFAWQGL